MKKEKTIKSNQTEMTSDTIEISNEVKEGYFWLDDLIKRKDEFMFKDNDTLKTNINLFDNFLNGLVKEQLYIFAGRPSTGKTTFILNLIFNSLKNLKDNEIIVFLSLEMSAKEILNRFLKLVENDKEAYDLLINRRKLLIIDFFNQNVTGIKNIVTNLQKQNVVKSILIDHLQLLELDKSKSNLLRYEKITQITRELKIIAKTKHVNIFAISQLSRDVEKRNAGEPQLSDLRDSGAIEQDADAVIFLTRLPNDPKYRSVFKNQILIAKNRNGALSSIECLFYASKFLFKFPNLDENHKIYHKKTFKTSKNQKESKNEQ